MKIEAGSPWLAMNRSVQGLKRSSTGLSQAASDVVDSTMEILNRGTDLPRDRVSLTGSKSMDEALVDLKLYEHGYSANLRTAQVSDEAIESMLDMILPHREDGRG